MTDIATTLGATSAISVERFSIYVTDTGAGGKLEDFEKWVETAMAVMFLISDGVTRIDVTGKWGHPNANNERTAIVYTFIENAEQFEGGLPRVASFAHTYGHRTGQDTVFLEWSGEYKDRVDVAEMRFASRSYRVEQYGKAVADDIPLQELFAHLARDCDLTRFRSGRPN